MDSKLRKEYIKYMSRIWEKVIGPGCVGILEERAGRIKGGVGRVECLILNLWGNCCHW